VYIIEKTYTYVVLGVKKWLTDSIRNSLCRIENNYA
jgi:hypothetical protein